MQSIYEDGELQGIQHSHELRPFQSLQGYWYGCECSTALVTVTIHIHSNAQVMSLLFLGSLHCLSIAVYSVLENV